MIQTRNICIQFITSLYLLDSIMFLVIDSYLICTVQIFPPDQGEEEVKVVAFSEEDKMKEYEKAAKRLANAKLVCSLSS